MATGLSIALLAPVETGSHIAGPHSGVGYLAHVRQLFEWSGIADTLTGDFEAADLILVLEPCAIFDYSNYAATLCSHPVIQQHADRCYAVNCVDRPWPLLPGMYVSLDYTASDPFLHCGCPHLHYPNPFTEDPMFADPIQPAASGHVACFRGSPTSRLRARMLDAAARGLFPEGINIHGPSQGSRHGPERQRSYCEEIRNHLFSLAPRGNGPSSFRLYESMALGRAPVVLADDWLAPGNVDWSGCSLFLPERDLMNIGQILAKEAHRARDLGTAAKAMYERHFSKHSVARYLVDSIDRIHHSHPYPKSPEWRLQHIRSAAAAAPAVPTWKVLARKARRWKRSLLK